MLYSQTSQRWQCNKTHVLWMLVNDSYRHTLRIYNTYCFSTVNGYAYVHHCYIIHKLPVLLTIFYYQKIATGLRALSFLWFNTAGNTGYWWNICSIFCYKTAVCVHSILPMNLISWVSALLNAANHSQMKIHAAEV
jgi:hypothetical protein